MSTLRCTNLQDTSGGNSLTTAQIYNGAAKAWVRFNGQGTVTIGASFNVSSITDDGTGNYRVNFTTSFSDVQYCFNCSTVVDNSNSSMFIGYITYNTTSTFGVGVYRNTVGFFDADRVCCSFFR